MRAGEVTGMVTIALCGVTVAVMVATSTITKNINQPYFYLYGTANLIAGLGLAAICAARGDIARLPPGSGKWIFLRGFFGMSVLMLSLMAVAFGAPLGDASALSSINIVVSAVLGRCFLGESLRLLHVLALCLSVVGAVFVAKPEAFFGAPEQSAEGGSPMLGYAVALASGFVSGGTFIASRKAQSIDPIVMTASVALMEGAASCILPLVGAVDELPMWAMLEAPGDAAALLLALFVLGLFGSWTMSLGSQLCPAAMSSTLFTSTSMSVSYVAQVVLHHAAPEPLTVMGAGLMLCGVSLLAFARWLYSPMAKTLEGREDAISGESEATSPSTRASEVASVGADDETESLASFVASEWSGLSPKVSRIRQRAGASTGSAPAPEILGFAGA